MVEKLRIHRQQHVGIMIEEADRVAVPLIGEPMSRIATTAKHANASMREPQGDLNKETEHGGKPGLRMGMFPSIQASRESYSLRSRVLAPLLSGFRPDELLGMN